MTAPVLGPDGVSRRWVYLHYFKEGQPSINWLDPTFAGMRLVIGDALHSLGDLGSGALRLDANGFLGVEKSAEGLPAWSEGHPLSEAANHLIASMVRKVGGFTFQELNLTIDDIAETSQAGADLSYDFINRPAYQHALAIADTEFLRLTLNASLEFGVQPRSLVHALQNHDQLTDVVHFATRHKNDEYHYRGKDIDGGNSRGDRPGRDDRDPHRQRRPVQRDLHHQRDRLHHCQHHRRLSGGDRPRRHRRGDHGGHQEAHLLLTKFNAWQPGVVASSGWDLCGMLPLEREGIRHLLATGDTRWIHRAAYDLMGYGENPAFLGMPRGRSLYGTLPAQLVDPTSFVSGLKEILDIRSSSGVATATQVDVPPVSHKGMLVMVHQLDEGDRHHVAVLNFSADDLTGTIRSKHLVPGSAVLDMATGEQLGEVDDLNSFSASLTAHDGLSLMVTPPEAVDDDPA